jgi:hypothetical protein
MKKITTEKELDELMSAKLLRISRKYPQMCGQYLVELHKAIDWAEAKSKEIKK